MQGRGEANSNVIKRRSTSNLSHLFTLESPSSHKTSQAAAGDSASSTEGEVCRRSPSRRQLSQSAASVLRRSRAKLGFMPISEDCEY